MKNKKLDLTKLSQNESLKASLELSDSYFNSNLTNTSTVKNESPSINLKKISNEDFLKKKRKNSDLNFENFASLSNSKSSKKNSPFLSDSKITNYFPKQKTSSSNNSNELLYSNKSDSSKLPQLEKISTSGSRNKIETDDKLLCAKKLDFDLKDEPSFNNYDFNTNFNLQYANIKNNEIDSKFLNYSHLPDLNKNLNLNFYNKEKLFTNINSDYLIEKNYDGFNTIKNISLSQKTLDVLNKIELTKKAKISCSSPKTLKINLEKLSNEIIMDRLKIRNKSNDDININKPNFSFKTNLKNNSPIKNVKSSFVQSDLVKSTQEILSNYSIKEKYEELLKRELILPCHFKAILKKFTKLDEILNYLKRIGEKDNSLKNIQKILYQNFKFNFTQDDFEKILFIAPHFFIYRWDKNFIMESNLTSSPNQIELFIDVPNDITRRLSHKYDEKVNFVQLQTFPYIPLITEMSEEILKERASAFKKVLLYLTNEYHKKFIKEKRILTKLNPFKHRTWHSEFDVHGVPQLENFKLYGKPRNTN